MTAGDIRGSFFTRSSQAPLRSMKGKQEIGGTRDTLTGTAIAAGFFLLYLVTMEQGIGWGSGAEVGLRSASGDLVPRLDSGNIRVIAGYLLGYLSPLSGIPHWFSQNFVSVFSGAVSPLLLFLTGRRLGWSRAGSAAASLSFGFSHSFWHASVTSGRAAISILLLLLTVYYLVRWIERSNRDERWSLYFFFFFLGLGLNNSLFFYLLLPGVVVLFGYRWKDWDSQRLVKGMAFLLPGVALFFVVLLLSFLESGGGLGFFSVFSTGPTGPGLPVLTGEQRSGPIAHLMTYLYQFPLFGTLLVLAGMYLSWRKHRGLLLFMGIPLVFVVFLEGWLFTAPESVIVASGLLAVFLLNGTGWLVRETYHLEGKMRSAPITVVTGILLTLLLSPILLYASILDVQRGNSSLLYGGREGPYWKEESYMLQPWKQDHRGTLQLWEDVQHIPSESTLVAAEPHLRIIQYHRALQTDPERKDLQLKDPRNLAGNPVDVMQEWYREAKPVSPGGTQPFSTPGLFSLNGRSVYRRDRLKSHFYFRRLELGSTETSSPGTGPSGPVPNRRTGLYRLSAGKGE